MFSEVRREKVIDFIKKYRYVEIDKLARELKVSESTIRRDLEVLQGKGILERTFGGAKSLSNNFEDFTFFKEQINCNKDKKIKIAKIASGIVKDGETVMIDAGTTAYYVAEQLKNRKIQVVTHSLPVINLLADSNVELICIGGTMSSKAGVFLSSLTEETFKQINADKFFIGVGGIDEEKITNRNMLLVGVQKTMMSVSKEIIVVADYAKFNRKVLNYLCDISDVHKIITDSKVPKEYKDICRKKKVTLTIA